MSENEPPQLGVHRIVMHPQPKCGRPFRISGCLDKLWFNETRRYRDNPKVGLELYRWTCPFGDEGHPEQIDGVWYWVEA